MTGPRPPSYLCPRQIAVARNQDASERLGYQLFLSVNDIDHTKTKVKSLQTNGICERFHKTILQEFYQVDFESLPMGQHEPP